MTMNLTETADERAVNESTLSPPILPGTPVKVEGRLDRYVLAQDGPGTLVVLWSATGYLLADRWDVTPLSAEADPSALTSVALVWLHELGQVLGASEVLRLAAVQSGCTQAWLVKSNNLQIARNDYEEESEKCACFCAAGMGEYGGDVCHSGGESGHVENVAVGQPETVEAHAPKADRERPLGVHLYPGCAVQLGADARLHGQQGTAPPASEGH